jgi:hypothetical protein
MAATQMQVAQTKFMMNGGVYEMPLQMLREQGILDADYVYREYPKMLRFSQGFQEVNIPREDHKGRTWVETVSKEIFEEIIVNSAEEEDRVLSGGKSSAAIEEERQGLFRRCSVAGIKADPAWTIVRLKRELGEVLDAPPVDEMSALKEKLAQLEEMAAMKAKIEALEAQLSGRDEVSEMRSQLTSLGVKVDGRWSATKLREELEKATA